MHIVFFAQTYHIVVHIFVELDLRLIFFAMASKQVFTHSPVSAFHENLLSIHKKGHDGIVYHIIDHLIFVLLNAECHFFLIRYFSVNGASQFASIKIRVSISVAWDTMEQKFYEGKTGIIAGTLSSTQIYDNKMRSVNGEESELVILPPAKGVAQGYRAEDVTKEERGFAMNIDSKNKDAAWAVLEFMASPEGRILDKVGIEGKHYTVEDNKIVFTDRWPEWWARFWDTTNNFDPQNPSLAQPVLTTVGQSAFDNLEKYIVQDVNILIPEEMTPQWDAMTGYYKEYSADIIRGVKPIDAFDEMTAKWDEAGGTEFESILVEELGNP